MADIFDALYSERPYRPKMPLDKAKQIIIEDSEQGCLDNKVVSALVELLDDNLLDWIIEK